MVEIGVPPSFNTRSDMIHFGRLTPGNEAKRNFTIENIHSKKIWVSMVATGDIASYIILNETRFSLDPMDQKNVDIFIKIPKNSMREYTTEEDYDIINGSLIYKLSTI